MENCKKRGLSVVCKGWVGGVSDYKGGSTQQDFLFWRKGEPPKVDLQDSAAFALATVRIGGWEGDCRERKTRTMPAIIQMKHEGGLARVVEMVREKYGQICEIYRFTNQWDCLLTWRGSVQEGEGGLRDEALGSGCLYWMDYGWGCNSQRLKTQKDHLPGGDERQCISDISYLIFPCLTIKEWVLIWLYLLGGNVLKSESIKFKFPNTKHKRNEPPYTKTEAAQT